MPTTLQDCINRVRSNLEEPSARFWTDTELTNWINDGCRDLARRTEDLLTFDQGIIIPSNTGNLEGPTKFPLPPDLIRIHRVEFTPIGIGSQQIYYLQASTYQEMDQYWGVTQATPSSFPIYYVLWGTPGMSGRNQQTIQLYPNCSQAGNLNIFYYRLPRRFTDPLADSSQYGLPLEIVEGWDDAVVMFCTVRAAVKDRDPVWKDLKAEYEELVQQMVDVTRQFHDQGRAFQHSTTAVPQWLTDSGGWDF
jgi:hypothetical protein